MCSMTPERSAILSMMMDDVVGTPEMIKIRRDFCRICDHLLWSTLPIHANWHYTGSKAEGLDLPGSDDDTMVDVNDVFHLTVVRTLDNIPETSPSYGLFLMCTENVPPGFALLHRLKYGWNPIQSMASKNINGIPYLSSNMLVDFLGSQDLHNIFRYFFTYPRFKIKYARQGPSIEMWTEFQDRSKSRTDIVLSIRCPFWPTSAQEWIDRPRHFGWPGPRDLSHIISFGCHLVPVGHPNSTFKTTEWRISFSVAERILVWSFNHVQLQCYAVMKIILKEFIKEKCRPKNFVLCSYFVKTLLFWKFETTDSFFWHKNNLPVCIRYLMNELFECIREGVLRHYFFPKFNLLSVKLTREAQVELLNIIDIAIQRDIRIFQECTTLRNVWSTFLAFNGNMISLERRLRSKYALQIDNHMMKKVQQYIRISAIQGLKDSSTRRISDISSETPLLYFALKCFLLNELFLKMMCFVSNKDVYRIHRLVHDDELSFDISTCKLWYAIFIFLKGDYVTVLTTVNKVLSRIPPYALYSSVGEICSWTESKNIYLDKFINSNVAIVEKAKTSWLFDLHFSKQCTDNVPLAIQIELYFSDIINGAQISPFAFTYYMMFVCYHELRQYDDREQVLRQLAEVVNNPEQCGNCRHHSYNLVGHCLLVAGKIHRARDMFRESYKFTRNTPLKNYNSASWYLHNFC